MILEYLLGIGVIRHLNLSHFKLQIWRGSIQQALCINNPFLQHYNPNRANLKLNEAIAAMPEMAANIVFH